VVPVLLFTYNRPFHTKQVLDALANNKESSETILYIISDGKRLNITGEESTSIDQLHELISKENRFKKVVVEIRKENSGLANSIITGVTKLVQIHKKLIVLEDDIIPSTGFLDYMNGALSLYENDKNVGCIHAWNYDLATDNNADSTFFLPGGDCWGWGTWEDSWSLFEKDGVRLQSEIEAKGFLNKFNRRGLQNCSSMLQDQIDGKNNSWAIRWNASLILAGKLCLHPTVAIVKNIGLDGSGEHCEDTTALSMKTVDHIALKKIEVVDSEWFYQALRNTMKNTEVQKHPINSFTRIKGIIKRVITSILLRLVDNQENSKSDKKDILGWYGDYSSFSEASALCGNYDSQNILEQCKSAILKVKRGDAAYERDSVIFDKIQHSWGLLSGLQKAAIDNNNVLNVIDFGGSLGSSYFQNRTFLEGVNLESWNVVEQEHFVSCGNDFVKDDKLKFWNNVDDVIDKEKCNVLLLSGVLQYLPDPIQLINEMISYNFSYIIIDRTSFIQGKDRLTIQNIADDIYEASYPCLFFNKSQFVAHFGSKYELIGEVNNSLIDGSYQFDDGVKASWEGLILKKIR